MAYQRNEEAAEEEDNLLASAACSTQPAPTADLLATVVPAATERDDSTGGTEGADPRRWEVAESLVAATADTAAIDSVVGALPPPTEVNGNGTEQRDLAHPSGANDPWAAAREPERQVQCRQCGLSTPASACGLSCGQCNMVWSSPAVGETHPGYPAPLGAPGSIPVLAVEGSASGVSPGSGNGEEGAARKRGASDETASEAGGDTGGRRGSQRPAKKSWEGMGCAARRALRPREPESATSIGDMAPDAF